VQPGRRRDQQEQIDMSTTARHWPDLAGRLAEDATGRYHVLPIRVYFEDTDFAQVVYHASYVRWCERGRSDFLRLLGQDARRLIDGSESHEPAAFVVRRMNMDFYRPGRIDDLLEVETRVKEFGGASITLVQTVKRDGQRLFEAEVVLVLVAVSGKPLRLSAAIRSAFGHEALP
jgi:acyl-CoA thioester hydrolase